MFLYIKELTPSYISRLSFQLNIIIKKLSMQIDSQSLNLEAKKIALERDAVQALRRIEAQRLEFELNKQRWADEQQQLDQQLEEDAAAAAEA